MSIVVNLFGVPSAGKSTGAAYIFSQLKLAGVNCELVTEYAKDKEWEENKEIFKPENQVYIFAKQFYRMNRCKDKVDVIITDSPLLLSAFYNKSAVLGREFNNLAAHCFNSFYNKNYLLLRDKPYNPRGRLQTEEESDNLKKPLLDLLNKYEVEFETALGNVDCYDKIVQDVLREL